MICDPWEVVVVPSPFPDRTATKRRPALVLSRRGFNAAGHSLLAMITSKAEPPWPGDTALRGREEAGLGVACIVRLKLFTLDNRLLVRRLGKLAEPDRRAVSRALSSLLPAGSPALGEMG